MQMLDGELRRVVGAADIFELLSSLFAFPTMELAQALSQGSVESDARGCLADIGADEGAITSTVAPLGKFVGLDAEELYRQLRIDYSLLYLAPGAHVPVFPYEAAFRYVADGRDGVPSLFRSPVTLDAEHMMHEAGVEPSDARVEPADSIWNEFAFLSYLFGCWARALSAEGDSASDEASQRHERILTFWEAHGEPWMIPFMEQTQRMSPAVAKQDGYEWLAQVALPLIGEAVAVARKDGGR